METKKSFETVNVNFEYQIVNVNDRSLIYAGNLTKEYTEKQIQEMAEIMKQKNGGFPMELCDIGNIVDEIYEVGIMDFAEYHSDEDEDMNNITIEVSDEMPDDLKTATAKYIPTLKVSVPYYYHADGKEEKVEVDYQLKRDVYDKMVKIAQTPLKGKTPFAILKEIDEVAVHEIIFDTMEEAISKMKEGHAESEPYLNDFPWQVYCNL